MSCFSKVLTEYSRCSVWPLYSSWLELSNSNHVQASGGVQSAAPPVLVSFPHSCFFPQIMKTMLVFTGFSQILLRAPASLLQFFLWGALLWFSVWQIPADSAASPGLVCTPLNGFDSPRPACFPSLHCGLECASRQNKSNLKDHLIWLPFSQQMSEICENSGFIHFIWIF